MHTASAYFICDQRDRESTLLDVVRCRRLSSSVEQSHMPQTIAQQLQQGVGRGLDRAFHRLATGIDSLIHLNTN